MVVICGYFSICYGGYYRYCIGFVMVEINGLYCNCFSYVDVKWGFYRSGIDEMCRRRFLKVIGEFL